MSTRDHLNGDWYVRMAYNDNQHKFNIAALTASGSDIKVQDLTKIITPATSVVNVPSIA